MRRFLLSGAAVSPAELVAAVVLSLGWLHFAFVCAFVFCEGHGPSSLARGSQSHNLPGQFSQLPTHLTMYLFGVFPLPLVTNDALDFKFEFICTGPFFLFTEEINPRRV